MWWREVAWKGKGLRWRARAREGRRRRLPAGRAGERGGVRALLESGVDLADDVVDDAGHRGGEDADDDERDQGDDQAVLDGGLPLLATDLGQESLEVRDEHVVVHPPSAADRFRDLRLAASPTRNFPQAGAPASRGRHGAPAGA